MTVRCAVRIAGFDWAGKYCINEVAIKTRRRFMLLLQNPADPGTDKDDDMRYLQSSKVSPDHVASTAHE